MKFFKLITGIIKAKKILKEAVPKIEMLEKEIKAEYLKNSSITADQLIRLYNSHNRIDLPAEATRELVQSVLNILRDKGTSVKLGDLKSQIVVNSLKNVLGKVVFDLISHYVPILIKKIVSKL